MRRRRAVVVVLLLSGLLWAAADPARAAVDPAALADRVAEPWPGMQRADGSFPEYLPARSRAARRGRDAYGDAMMGYGLLLAGVRSGNRGTVDAGRAAVSYASRHRTHGQRAVFENLALAASYNLLRGALAAYPGSAATAGRVRPALRRARLEVLGGPRPYFNYDLVESVAVLELLRSGLRSDVPGTVLANRARARRLVDRLLARRVESVAREHARVVVGTRTTIVSDPPWNPPAYHAFSLALVARAAGLTPNAATARRLRALLTEMTAGSAGLMAPDGDVSYFGRSQEQSWTLAMTAFGALESAGPDGATVAARALQRFDTLHAGGPQGVFLTPALRADADRGLRGLDPYVSGPAYAGLTLVGLEWAAAAVRPPGDPAASVALDAAGHVVLARGAATFATIRTPAVWYAVKLAPAVETQGNAVHAHDLRYDGGLVALKVRHPDGSWSDVMPVRPRADLADGGGPVRLAGGGVRQIPVGRRLVPAGPGNVRLVGTLRDPRTRRGGRAVELRYAATSCGVSITFGVRRGERFEYSLFFRRRPTVVHGRSWALTDGAQVVALSEKPGFSRIAGGYASGSDPVLYRVRLRLRTGEARPLSLSLCAFSGDETTTDARPARGGDVPRERVERARRAVGAAGLGGGLLSGTP